MNIEYINPVIYADYSDPDVIRTGEDYYMTASSFSNVPGLPVLHSKNLVSWELIGYALEKLPDRKYFRPQPGCGVWAPAIRYHEGHYYIFFPMPDEGIFAVRSADPYGQWEEPVKVYDGAGFIDPCPLWDGDKAYLVCAVAKSRIGFQNVLYMFEMDPDSLKLISGPVKVYEGGDENPVTEGPKLYKKDGYYWIFAPAGGVKTGWQLAMRSKDIFGPYEARTVMKQAATGVNGPHQGAWVTDTKGGDWFVHFQDVFAAGRITHLQPMTWKDGWPVIGKDTGKGYGEPVLSWKCPPGEDIQPAADGLTDNNGKLSDSWQWNAQPQSSFYSVKDGGIVLNAIPADERTAISDLPNLLLRKWEAPEFSASFEIYVNDLAEGSIAGLVNYGINSFGLFVKRTKEGLDIFSFEDRQSFICGSVFTKETINKVATVEMTDKLKFLYKVECSNSVTATSPKPEALYGKESTVIHPEERVYIKVIREGAEAASYSSVAAAGRWVGCKYGLFCANRLNVKKITQFVCTFSTIFVAHFTKE